MFLLCLGRWLLESKSQLWSVFGTPDQLNLRWKRLNKGWYSQKAFCPRMEDYRFSLWLNDLNPRGKCIFDKEEGDCFC